MKEKRKSPRTKPNSIQVKNKIHDDSLAKWNYILPSQESIEFKRPPISKTNKRLSFFSPIAQVDASGRYTPGEKMGQLTTFYIPTFIYSKLKEHLTEFNIPNEFHDDLYWAFLNMVFAASEASSETKWEGENYKNLKSWLTAFNILENIAEEKYILKEITFEYDILDDSSNKIAVPTSSKVKTNRFKESNVLELVVKMIQNYKTAESYDLSKLSFDYASEHGIYTVFDGYKNVAKKWQSYLSVVLYDFLTDQSITKNYGFVDGRITEPKLKEQIKPILSSRKTYLFIGKLMVLSGLMEIKEKTKSENNLDEVLIESIEKKIHAEIGKKKRSKRYKNLLLGQGIEGFQIPPFYFHFVK